MYDLYFILFHFVSHTKLNIFFGVASVILMIGKINKREKERGGRERGRERD